MKRKKRRGYLLLEVIGSLTILAIIMIPTSSYIKISTRLSNERDVKTELEYITYGLASTLAGYTQTELANLKTKAEITATLDLKENTEKALTIKINPSERSIRCSLYGLESTYKIP